MHRLFTPDTSVVRLDPGRIASYAIASMGFLGAGAIITGKGTVRGLTTAAGLWLVTGVGLAIGAGYLLPALIGVFLSLLSLLVLRHAKTMFHRDSFTILIVKFNTMEGHLEQVREILAANKIRIHFVNYQLEPLVQKVTYRLRLFCKEVIPWGHVIKMLSACPNLEEINWQEGEVP